MLECDPTHIEQEVLLLLVELAKPLLEFIFSFDLEWNRLQLLLVLEQGLVSPLTLQILVSGYLTQVSREDGMAALQVVAASVLHTSDDLLQVGANWLEDDSISIAEPALRPLLLRAHAAEDDIPAALTLPRLPVQNND